MKKSIVTIIIASLGTFGMQANAQPPVPSAPKPKQSEFVVEGVSDTSSDQKRNSLKSLEQAKELLVAEQTELTEKWLNAKTDCEKEELRLRQMDHDFLVKRADQIQEIVTDIKRSLNIQLGMMRSFQEGLYENDPVIEFTNADGKKDQSVMIEIDDTDTTGAATRKQIPVKELFRYIQKFENEAKSVGESEAEVEAFLNRYRNLQNETSKDFFFMTLDQAIEAYKVRLNSVFQKSNRQRHTRQLELGSGKHLFRVITTTTLGWDGYYRSRVGTMLSGEVKDKSDIKINMVQDFGEALNQAEENRYWEVIRNQQLTIDGIPIDGYLRRQYFDQMRSIACQRETAYTFKESSKSGPFLSYSEKDPCTKRGMQVISASMEKTANHGGSARVGAVFDITAQMKEVAQMKETVQSNDGFRSVVTSLGMAGCDDVRFRMTYSCGCDPTPIPINMHYKLGNPIKIGCK